DGRRTCAELVDDRAHRISDVEAWFKMQRDELLRLENELQQQHAIAQLQQAELQRRQRSAESQNWASAAVTAAGLSPGPPPSIDRPVTLGADCNSPDAAVTTYKEETWEINVVQSVLFASAGAA
ncbi:unnamed protein product, partial [Polarella glacialis]